MGVAYLANCKNLTQLPLHTRLLVANSMRKYLATLGQNYVSARFMMRFSATRALLSKRCSSFDDENDVEFMMTKTALNL